MLKWLLFALCCPFALTAVLGQTTYTWTGAADGTNLAVAGNWTTNGTTPAVSLPSGQFQDTAQWDGVTTSNLLLSYGSFSVWPGTGFGTLGVNLVLTAKQTNSVQIISSVVQSGNVGINNITVNGPSGQFVLGGGVPGNEFVFISRPAGATHDWINNSTNPAVICPNVGFQAGGGASYTIVFDGSGDWRTTNDLRNAANTGTWLAKLGTGTWYWNGPSTPGNAPQPNSPLNSPLTFNGGTVVLQWANNNICYLAIQNNGTLLKYDAPAQTQTLSGVISGTAPLQVNNGTLILGGLNTYTGSTILSGGELIVNSAENPGISGPLGVTNTISFNGGTLGFSVNNVCDYSFRFSSAAGQAYSIDTGGQSVTFTNTLGSSGGTLTKLGAGTLMLAGPSSYSGATAVSAGRLVFQGSKAGSGDITVADGAALGVVESSTQVTPGTLTLGTGTGCTLEFNNVTNTTTAPLAAGTLYSVGTVTINLNSGTLVIGQCYPLLTWTNGSAPVVSLGTVNGGAGNLTTNGNTIQLCVTAITLVWTGANSGNWSDPNNWTATYFDPAPVQFDDTASGTTSVIVDVPVHPASVTVNNSAKIYSIASSGVNSIAGSTGLTKSSSGTLTLSGGANTYTGITALVGGTVSVSTLTNGGLASDIGAASSAAANLVLNGGALQYTGGGANIDRSFTVGTAGATIDASGSGALNLATPSLGYSGNGPHTLTLAGANTDNNTLAASLGDYGGASALTKNGAGTWVLTATNTFSGVTVINDGVLQVGAGGGSGSLGSGNIIDNGSLFFNRTGSLTVVGVISGTGTLTVTNGTVKLTGNNTYSSAANQAATTVIANGATLQLGNGGASGKLDGASGIVDNGTLILNSTAAQTYVGFNAVISGTGNVIDVGSGLVKAIGNNTYTGWTYIGAGATFQPCDGNQGQLYTSVITNNGTLKLVRQDYGVFGITNNVVGSGRVWKDSNNPNDGNVAFLGTNTYTGGTYIAGGAIVLGDGGTPGAGSIVGSVLFTNSLTPFDTFKSLIFNRPDNFTFTNLIATAPTVLTGAGASTPVNQGAVVQFGSGVLTLTANNTYAGGTIISNGVLVVGNGGTTGTIGTNAANVQGTLVFNRSDNVMFPGGITGEGSVVQAGSGTLTLTSANTLTGATVVSNGTLAIGSAAVGGDLNACGGKLVAGGAASVSPLNVAGNMNISAGTVVANLNKSLSPSNTVFSVAGTVAASAGGVKLVNLGPALAVGDKFTLFSQPVQNGAALTVTGAGQNWANHLAEDGSVTVLTAPWPWGVLNFTNLGNRLQFSWIGSFKLQSQTNSLNVGIGTNWVDYPGGDTNPITVPMDATKGTVFFRLVPAT
ncbi:MAG TPA: autotransporter-associated beta strand repeat-containing protein [Candidatus Acidoferrum sp.]|nr:autotransporter-associated beta strand repeat-containing protein [Candidatus Acidoferrum sp.]